MQGRRPKTRTRATEQSSYHGSEFSNEELEWIRAVSQWQKETRIKYPALRDYLAIAHSLGYRKVESQTGSENPDV